MKKNLKRENLFIYEFRRKTRFDRGAQGATSETGYSWPVQPVFHGQIPGKAIKTHLSLPKQFVVIIQTEDEAILLVYHLILKD